MSKKACCSIDIVDIKQKLLSGSLAVKINMFGSILLEDTRTCEAIQLMQLPEGYSFHDKGTWKHEFVHTSCSIDHPLQGEYRWVCSECGWDTEDKHDWCVCGADMRGA
jgi:hypothetical protein